MLFAIWTAVDLVLTSAFVAILRQRRTGFVRYVFASCTGMSTSTQTGAS